MVGALESLFRHQHVGWGTLCHCPQPYRGNLEFARPLRCDLASPHGELANPLLQGENGSYSLI